MGPGVSGTCCYHPGSREQLYDGPRNGCARKKTGRPAKFKLSDQTRQAIGNFLITAAKKPEEFLFAGRRGPGHCMITRNTRGPV